MICRILGSSTPRRVHLARSFTSNRSQCLGTMFRSSKSTWSSKCFIIRSNLTYLKMKWIPDLLLSISFDNTWLTHKIKVLTSEADTIEVDLLPPPSRLLMNSQIERHKDRGRLNQIDYSNEFACAALENLNEFESHACDASAKRRNLLDLTSVVVSDKPLCSVKNTMLSANQCKDVECTNTSTDLYCFQKANQPVACADENLLRVSSADFTCSSSCSSGYARFPGSSDRNSTCAMNCNNVDSALSECPSSGDLTGVECSSGTATFFNFACYPNTVHTTLDPEESNNV